MLALICACGAPGLIWLLQSPTGRAFNDSVFTPLYTLGALLVIAFWGLLILGALALALVFLVLAWVRQEPMRWKLAALGFNLLVPLALFLAMKR